MIDVVFISDLHLHPLRQDIKDRFDHFIQWAQTSVKSIYILGDFFHAWAGDDSIDEWSSGIAMQLRELKKYGISVYYLHGNRDFLLGTQFAELAGWTLLFEPTLIELGDKQIMLVHGDRYCTKDKSHQRFRLLTRNKLFSALFLCLPLKYRKQMVNKVREMSFNNQNKTTEQMDVVSDAVVKHMKRFKIRTLIHGHTHKPGVTCYDENGIELTRYVLSDWDDNPLVLCYNKTKGVYFDRF